MSPLSAARSRAGAPLRAEVEAEVCAHKLYPPKTMARLVKRQELLARIAGSPARVILLQGPAGHGKTTLLLQLKAAEEARGWRTAWLSLDDADNDPRRLFPHIQALVRSLGPTQGPIAPIPGRAYRRSDWIIGRLLEMEGGAALFLDEFQTLTTPALLQFFRELIESLPPGVRLYIGARSIPDIGLPRAQVEGRALVIPAEELRFTLAEAKAFFDVADQSVPVSGEELEAIYRRTEGWPAALQLFRLSLTRREVRDGLGTLPGDRPRDLAAYLTDNVLALQTVEIQRFLLLTAPLIRLTAPLCEAVTGRGGAQALLEHLERSGLFLRALDPGPRWFKYHGLFASCLVDQLSVRDGPRLLAVHRAAARWFRRQGLYAETLHHALAGGDHALAADALADWAGELVCDGQLVTLARWADALPTAALLARPELMVKVAWAYVFLRRQEALAPLLPAIEEQAAKGGRSATIVLAMFAIARDDREQAARCIAEPSGSSTTESGFAAFELGAAGNLAAYLALADGHFDAAEQRLVLARRHTERGPAPFSLGYNLAVKGVLELLRGQLTDAVSILEHGTARAHADPTLAVAATTACEIWAFYEAGQFLEAEALFDKHRDIILSSTLLDFTAVALLAKLRAASLSGRPAVAMEWLVEGETLARAQDWTRLSAMLGWERVSLALAAGESQYARRLAQDLAPPPPPDSRAFADEFADTFGTSIRLALCLGDLTAATATLETALERARDRPYRQLRLGLCEVLRLQRSVGERAALPRLSSLLSESAGGVFVGCIAEQGPALIPLLTKLRQAPPLPLAERLDDLDRLIAACGGGSAAASGGRALVEPLTDRETEVLKLLAMGASNKEIARRTFVSENTIKFHLKNIYAKLGVCSRVRALRAAREAGLIA